MQPLALPLLLQVIITVYSRSQRQAASASTYAALARICPLSASEILAVLCDPATAAADWPLSASAAIGAIAKLAMADAPYILRANSQLLRNRTNTVFALLSHREPLREPHLLAAPGRSR
jgi:hypothetical protein